MEADLPEVRQRSDLGKIRIPLPQGMYVYRALAGEMRTTQIVGEWHLEPCRYCKGTAELSMIPGCRIICEYCDGVGFVWTERCALIGAS